MEFRAEIRILPRPELLDPQGKAVEGALHGLGFHAVRAVHVGRLLVVEFAAPSFEAARAEVDAMCRQLLANPVIENYVVVLEPLAQPVEG